MTILESSQRTYTEKMQIIQDLCNYYSIPYVDTIALFSDDYHSLTDDEIHPNDSGQLIYAQAVENAISELVESREKLKSYDITPMNEEVLLFTNFQYLDSDKFERVDALTYRISELSISGIIGIDYSYQDGENITNVYVDGELFSSLDVSFNYGFSQRHIQVLSNNECTVEDIIEIVFSSEALADSFNGLIICWEC